jgi:hypothetical protein
VVARARLPAPSAIGGIRKLSRKTGHEQHLNLQHPSPRSGCHYRDREGPHIMRPAMRATGK